MSEEFTSKVDETDEHRTTLLASSEDTGQESNTNEEEEGTPRGYSLCLKEASKEKVCLSKNELPNIAVKWMPKDAQETFKLLLTKEPSTERGT